MLGGALMLVLGVLTPADALLAINLDVLLLLVGMMVLVAGLDVCGFFDLVSSRIALQAKSQVWFLAWLMIATAALSALVLNDTIALLVTPVVVRSARALRVNPVPYLVAVAIAANVGSVATEVGNPQNAFIAIRSGIPFLTFTAYLLPVTIVCLAIAIAGVRLAFRRDLAAPIAGAVAGPIVPLQRRGLTLAFGVAAVVPAVLLLAEVVPQGSTQLWLALGASSTLAGNATILGAACNVIVVQVASREGVSVTMKDFVKAGLPVTAATLIVSTVLIALLVPA